jgi:nucleotide-binding universal stress UspA family protein
LIWVSAADRGPAHHESLDRCTVRQEVIMAYKTLLVQAQASDQADARIKLAVDVAAMFDAKVIGLAAEGFYPMVTTGSPIADGAVIQAVRERIAADLPMAEQRFRSLTPSVAAGIGWVTGYDYPASEMARHARGADLLIASRPPRGCGPDFAAPVAELVLTCGAPVLVTPTTGGTLEAENVVVAWKNTREARRALADAMPFLMRAHKVTVLAVSGDGEDIEKGGLDEVARRLARHGVVVETLVAPKGRASVAQVVEETAMRLSADLIVMGAYGHSRIQEWMLGGATEDLLVQSSQFVLFSH